MTVHAHIEQPRASRIVRAWRWFRCRVMGDHAWTCHASLGIPPTAKQLRDGLAGWNDYATMYCKHCGDVYDPYGWYR